MRTRRVWPTLGWCGMVALLSACTAQPNSAQGRQLDNNFATTIGVGSMTGVPTTLPHGRYTFFSSADPPDCVSNIALLDRLGTPVANDASVRAMSTGNNVGNQTMPTLVQQELQSGPYRLRVTTRTAGCAWQVQQILNYVLGNETPLKPILPPTAPALDVALDNASRDRHFHVETSGLYQYRWAVTPCDRYSGDLVRADGGVLHLGDGQGMAMPPGSYAGPEVSQGPVFLGVGDWTARVSTHCFWQIGITPWRGPTGGGGQGFRG